MRRTLARLLPIAMVLLAGSPAFAWQEQPATGVLEAEAERDLSTSEQTVEVDERVDDGRIAERLAEILEATERFSSVAVEVREGVVFLSGTTQREESRTLAGDIARRTQGVVAIVNNITIEQGPIWTLEPAKRELLTLWRQGIATAPLVAVGLVVLVLTFVAASLAQRVVTPVLGRSTNSELLRGVLRKVVYVLVLLVGVYIALRISGLTRVALTVVSGTGIIGLVLGFAFRDIAENFLASLLLSVQRPFRLGDVIEVDGHTGVVRKVTSRGTLLMDFDGNHIQISNAKVYKSTIRNFTANPLVRLSFTVGIGYDDDIAHAQGVLLEMLTGHPAVLAEPEPLVLVELLGSSTVNLRAYYWIDGTKHSMLKVGSAAMRLAKAALTREGISMPDESREVIFPKGVPVRMVEGDAGVQRPSGPAPVEPRTPPASQEAPAATQAEGDLESETAELQKQAEASRDPEEGADVLDGERPPARA
jgi:small-conductance mechanosensitive channel